MYTSRAADVKDTGIGFHQQYADRIFNTFERLHTSQYPGTGIGLTICKKIVERHNGTITAQSTAGQGATFIIALPAKAKSQGRFQATR